MKRRARFALSCGAVALAACARQEDDDIRNLPAYGSTTTGAPKRTEPPRAPDPATYNGRPYGNSRPPQSGLHADPANPDGAPGTFAPPGQIR